VHKCKRAQSFRKIIKNERREKLSAGLNAIIKRISRKVRESHQTQGESWKHGQPPECGLLYKSDGKQGLWGKKAEKRKMPKNSMNWRRRGSRKPREEKTKKVRIKSIRGGASRNVGQGKKIKLRLRDNTNEKTRKECTNLNQEGV